MTTDPVEVMARAACWNSEKRWRVNHGNENHNCQCVGECSASLTTEKDDMCAALRALSEEGYAIIRLETEARYDDSNLPSIIGV